MRVFLVVLVFPSFLGCDPGPTKTAVAKKYAAMRNDQPDLSQIHDSSFQKYLKSGYGVLNEPEKVCFCIRELEDEVNNGGFHQYYFNDGGNRALDSVKALETIGAPYTAKLAMQANAVFGPQGPPPDRFKRQKLLLALPAGEIKKLDEVDREFYKYKENLEKLLTTYVTSNFDAFRPK
jgi:Domain of unknown function (DUF4375)